LKTNETDYDANWHKWFTGQGHETINFGVRGSKFKVINGNTAVSMPCKNVQV